MAEEGVRIDVWLWRARLCKTRALAAAKAGEGRMRLTRGEASGRIDRASRTVRVGDEIAFAIGMRAFAVRVLALGTRRGPPAEAQGLYAQIEDS
ncbi:MAG TPA: RNA-binding S4 domain-containing protein [Caulobacteraceae bacterium]